MADKQLSDSLWKAFAKSKGYKDATLLKALEALAKAAKASADEQLAALAEVNKQADALRKANKSDKSLGAYLDDVDKAVARERQQAEQTAREYAKADAAAEDEDDTSTLLTTKMTSLLRQVPKGEVMQVLIAGAGKEVVLLMSRRAIAPARRTLLTDRLGTTGGVKFIAGECIFEGEAHTFVVRSKAAGLAKKLKAAIMAQTELRCKVRVRGEDPNDIDEDGELAPGETPADPAAAAAALVATTTRLKELMPKLQAAIVGGHAQATELKLRAGEAVALVKQGHSGGAGAVLDALENLLAQAQPATTATTATTVAAAPATSTPAPAQRFANQAKARLAWQATRGRVAADLAKLEQAILAHYSDAPDLGELATKVRKLDGILGALDQTLIDKLDEALSAADTAKRTQLHGEARAIVARYSDFVRGDELVKSLDGNPFVPLSTHDTLVKSLQVLDRSLT